MKTAVQTPAAQTKPEPPRGVGRGPVGRGLLLDEARGASVYAAMVQRAMAPAHVEAAIPAAPHAAAEAGPTRPASIDGGYGDLIAAAWAPGAVVQRAPAEPAAVKKQAPATPQPAIDPPAAGPTMQGFIDNSDGAFIRTGPRESGGVTVVPDPLPPATPVFVSGRHPATSQWWYVTALLPTGLVRGYVQGLRVATDLPEPSAKLYQIKKGDNAEKLAKQEFSTAVEDGHDLRYYENVLLAVNRDKGRSGVTGTFQDPGIFGGGANNVQLIAGQRIWLVSPAYAKTLEKSVPSGSLTGGVWAKVKRFLGHILDIVKSVVQSPEHLGEVAGEVIEAIKDNIVAIIGITAAFIVAEAISSLLAAAPTGVSQIVAVLIQLLLAAIAGQAAVQAGIEALKHGDRWLTLAWSAKGDEDQIAEASREFVRMLVAIAMAALAASGAKASFGKALKIAPMIPPSGLAPAMVTNTGGVVSGGSVAATGPPAISPNLMSIAGTGGSKAVKDVGKDEPTTTSGSRSAPGKGAAAEAASLLPKEATAAQAERLAQHLERLRKTGALDEALLRRYLDRARDHLDDAITEVTRRTTSKELDAWLHYFEREGVVKPPTISPAEARVAQVDRAYKIGEDYGRAFAKGSDGMKPTTFENPFGPGRPWSKGGRYGKGIDDVLARGEEDFVVDYKGGDAKLAPGQLSAEWVQNKILELYYDDGPHGKEWARRLADKWAKGKLKGMVYTTEVDALGNAGKTTAEPGPALGTRKVPLPAGP